MQELRNSTTASVANRTLRSAGTPHPEFADRFDNNQHSPNENLRLGHFFDSIVTIAALMTVR